MKHDEYVKAGSSWYDKYNWRSSVGAEPRIRSAIIKMRRFDKKTMERLRDDLNAVYHSKLPDSNESKRIVAAITYTKPEKLLQLRDTIIEHLRENYGTNTDKNIMDEVEAIFMPRPSDPQRNTKKFNIDRKRSKVHGGYLGHLRINETRNENAQIIGIFSGATTGFVATNVIFIPALGMFAIIPAISCTFIGTVYGALFGAAGGFFKSLYDTSTRDYKYKPGQIKNAIDMLLALPNKEVMKLAKIIVDTCKTPASDGSDQLISELKAAVKYENAADDIHRSILKFICNLTLATFTNNGRKTFNTIIHETESLYFRVPTEDLVGCDVLSLTMEFDKDKDLFSCVFNSKSDANQFARILHKMRTNSNLDNANDYREATKRCSSDHPKLTEFVVTLTEREFELLKRDEGFSHEEDDNPYTYA